MNVENFIVNFAEQFDDVTVEMLSKDTKFRDLDEWSSLMALSIIAMADEAYGVTLTGEDISKSQTIGDLIEKIGNK